MGSPGYRMYAVQDTGVDEHAVGEQNRIGHIRFRANGPRQRSTICASCSPLSCAPNALGLRSPCAIYSGAVGVGRNSVHPPYELPIAAVGVPDLGKQTTAHRHVIVDTSRRDGRLIAFFDNANVTPAPLFGLGSWFIRGLDRHVRDVLIDGLPKCGNARAAF